MAELLSAVAVRQLREIARRVLREELGATLNRQSGNQTGNNHFVVKASTSGITGLTTSGPGSGTGTIHFRSTASVLTSSSESTTVYNLSSSPLSPNAFAIATQDNFGSLWILQGAGGASLIGRPTADHNSGTVGTYDVQMYNGTNYVDTSPLIQVSAYQQSGFQFPQDELCELQPHTTDDPDVPFVSNLHPYEDCEVGEALSFGAASDLTIDANGHVTITGGQHRLIPNSGTSDIVTIINGGTDGRVVNFTVKSTGHSITFQASPSTGNHESPANFVLTHPFDQIAFKYQATDSKWMRIINQNIN